MSENKSNAKPAKKTKPAKEPSTAKTAKSAKPVKEKKSAAKTDAPEETGALDDAPMIGESIEVLGTLSSNAETKADSSELPKRTHQKTESSEKEDASDAVPSVLTAEPPPETEPLKLARGAFIALRKSGGMNFSTREVVVYPDGRVAHDARGVPQKEYNRLRRALNDGQMLSLRKLLDHSNFWRAEGGGEHNPDAFAYEIVARLGQRSNEITLFDGSIPENLKPLVERLVKLLPE